MAAGAGVASVITGVEISELNIKNFGSVLRFLVYQELYQRKVR